MVDMTLKLDKKQANRILGINAKRYTWKPKEDITAYELALCMSVLCSNYSFDSGIVDILPSNARRHFEELK